MPDNLYHILSFMPAVEAWEMPRALEVMAQQLVASGKLRINADTHRNYARYHERTFTVRMLTDPALVDATRAELARHVAPAAGPHGVDDLIAHLMVELKKARGVDAAKEIKIARVLVQSAHPAVIQLLLKTGADVFVSYSHNVADLMPVHEWDRHATSGGLQATDADGAAVYVSAGGDPFFEGEHKHYVTDGFPALARMVVIAGQELGHFADLRRTSRGIVGRYSTDLHASQLRADPVARAAWAADQQNIAMLTAAYAACGLAWLRTAEKGVAFYHQRLRYSPPWWFYQLWRFVAWGRFTARCRRRGLLSKFNVLPRMRLGEAVASYLTDMAYNLTPEADAYRHPDPLVEEAIGVIEAVARVPQQVHKWGYSGVQVAWPGLFGFYYETVIPEAIQVGHNKCRVPTAKGDTTLVVSQMYGIAIFQRLIIFLRRRFRAKPRYYP